MTLLRGRDREIAAVEQTLAAAREGRSAVLALRGDAGVGKTALIDHARAAAQGMTVLDVRGVESEAELPFAGLHGLLAPLRDDVGRLPTRQREAVRAATGLGEATPADRFLVGVGLLTVLSDIAERSPLVLLVDDAQWLDHASRDALLFAVRRLYVEAIAVVLAERPRDGRGDLVELGLPTLDVEGVDLAAARQVLDDHFSGLPPARRERIIAEADGNPLALLCLPTEVSPAAAVPPPLAPVGGRESSTSAQRVRDVFARVVRTLPDATVTALVVAAADDTGESGVVLEAAGRLGATLADLAPAERADLVRVSAQTLSFRHPLIRAATYHEATAVRRLAAHRVLAAVLEERDDPDRAAWHRAAATTRPDEDVATALTASAEHARSRGGSSAVAAAYARAAALTPALELCGSRLVLAALAALDAGERERAGEYADRAVSLVRDPVERAHAVRVRAVLAAERNAHADAHAMLLGEAAQLLDDAPGTAGELLFNAVDSAWAAHDVGAVEAADAVAARLAAPDAGRARALARVAGGMLRPSGRGLADEVVPALRELVELHDRHGSDPGVRDGVLAARWLLVLGDHGSAYTRFSALERRCREEGSVGLLPRVLASLAICQQHRGRPYEAAASGEEGLRIAHDSGQYETVGHLTDILGHLAAIAGDEDRCHALLAEAADRVVSSAYPARAAGALALLDLGRGRYPSALERLRAVVPESGPLDVLSNVPDLVEVAVRLDEPDIAAGPADWFLSWAGASGQPWAEAVAHRCGALLAGTGAEEQYRAALGRHEVDGQRPFERARTQLLYGEWLRRLRRRGEARPHLKAAHLTFEGLGAAPWAERARDELRAAGESLPAERDTDLRSLLTPQEHQVVQLAADGLSNREIGAQLFLSSRTIGYHLYNAFPKLGVTSRTELARLFGENRTSDPVD